MSNGRTVAQEIGWTIEIIKNLLILYMIKYGRPA